MSRLIDADALLERMSTHCDLCQYNDHIHPCRRECDWHEAIDEVEDMDEIEIEQPQQANDGYQQALKEIDSNQAHTDAEDPITLEGICEKYGLTEEGVDYALSQYGIVINEITHGLLSKLTYDAKTIVQVAQERWCDTCDLKAEKDGEHE